MRDSPPARLGTFATDDRALDVDTGIHLRIQSREMRARCIVTNRSIETNQAAFGAAGRAIHEATMFHCG